MIQVLSKRSREERSPGSLLSAPYGVDAIVLFHPRRTVHVTFQSIRRAHLGRVRCIHSGIGPSHPRQQNNTPRPRQSVSGLHWVWYWVDFPTHAGSTAGSLPQSTASSRHIQSQLSSQLRRRGGVGCLLCDLVQRSQSISTHQTPVDRRKYLCSSRFEQISPSGQECDCRCIRRCESSGLHLLPARGGNCFPAVCSHHGQRSDTKGGTSGHCSLCSGESSNSGKAGYERDDEYIRPAS